MTWSEMQPLLAEATWQTLYMVGAATLIAVVVGLPLGVLLVLTDRGGLLHNTPANKVIGTVVNLGRSLPFVILLVALIPFTRWLVGTSLGATAAIVPLAVGAIPFFARLVETSVREVGPGLIEAVQSMGGGTWTVVRKALLPESLPSVVSGITTTVVALIGYSAMAGAVGAGGLGDLAIQYGYERFETDVMLATLAVLIVLVTAVQFIGDLIARSLASRGRAAAGGLRAAAFFGRKGAKAGTAIATAAALAIGVTAYRASSDESARDELTVVANPVPHAEILEYVQKNLAEKAGLSLRIRVVSDYVTPNTAVEDGSADANYFQNQPYLDDFNKKNGTHIVPVVTVHLEPLGLYSNRVTSLAALRDGSTVAVPNDSVNEARALGLLAANHLITLKSGVGSSATVRDITGNPRKLRFEELTAAQLPRSLDDVDAAVINGNYAISAGLKPAKDALALESAKNSPYGNFLAVKKGNEKDPRVLKLARLLTSPQVRKFIEDTYAGSVLPSF